MRPKVVILTLVAAFALLGMMAVLRGLAGKHAGDSGGQASGPPANGGPPSAVTNLATRAYNADNPADSEAVRAALIDKELEQIDELAGEVNGTNNPIIIPALLDKVESPEAPVRKAALAALVQIDDTSIVPGLQRVVAQITDPRAKVEVMDTIDFLKLPSASPAETPQEATNSSYPVVIPPDLKMNPAFAHTNSALLRRNSDQ